MILILLACGCGDESVDEPPVPWTVVEDGHRDGLLLSVWGRDPGDLWAVGGRQGRTLILRGDAERLAPIAAPGDATAWWVCGLGDGAVAVVGGGGMALVDAGEGLVAKELGLTGVLYGCWGTGVDDWWVVGGDRATGEPQLAHVSGDDVQAPHTELGVLAAQLPPTLYKVWGVDGWVFVVGDEGVAMTRSPEGDWSLERLGESGAPLFTVHGRSADDIWAVGGTGGGQAWRWDGLRWADARPPAGGGLSGVFVDNVGAAWVSGLFGRLLRHDASGGWEVEDAATGQTLHAVWADDEGTVWAVGGNVEEPAQAAWRGVVVRR